MIGKSEAAKAASNDEKEVTIIAERHWHADKLYTKGDKLMADARVRNKLKACGAIEG